MSKTKAHIRYKTKDGTIVPGVTTVLGLLAKPALIKWANNLGLQGIDSSKYVDDKADIGTLAHAFVTDQLTGKKTDTADYSANQIDKAQNAALSFWSWEKDHKIEEVYFCERPLVSEIHRFGGTLDIYARVNGKREIIDLKTGNGIWPEHIYQVAALKRLIEEHGHPVDGIRIVNIPRAESEAFAEHNVTEKESDNGWEIFRHLLAIHKLRK